jgi:hypothetical protein
LLASVLAHLTVPVPLVQELPVQELLLELESALRLVLELAFGKWLALVPELVLGLYELSAG